MELLFGVQVKNPKPFIRDPSFTNLLDALGLQFLQKFLFFLEFLLDSLFCSLFSGNFCGLGAACRLLSASKRSSLMLML